MCLKIKILKRREANQCILMYFILQSSLTGLILLSYSEFSYFFSKYKGLPEARTAAEPVREIRGGLQE